MARLLYADRCRYPGVAWAVRRGGVAWGSLLTVVKEGGGDESEDSPYFGNAAAVLTHGT